MRSFALVLLFMLGSCTTHKGFVNYKEAGIFSTSNAGNHKFEDVGPVTASAMSWAWENCNKVAEAAIYELKAKAKAHGGDTVYGVKFLTKSGIWVTEPVCIKEWGWAAILALGPWVTHSEVKGVAAKIVR
jgi:uncharacterized protein YbjQ (UPF0145 family)